MAGGGGVDEIVISDTEPTDENVEAWIDTSEEPDNPFDLIINDTLESEAIDEALSANQGRVLNNKILDLQGVTDNINQSITDLQNNKANKSDIVDNLTTADANKMLSANQGKILNDAISSVIESGSNENGNYIKFSDGTMICLGSVVTGTYNTSTCSSNVSWTFPKSFINTTISVCAQALGGNHYCYMTQVNIPLNSRADIILKGFPSVETKYIDTGGRGVSVIAIGKWK